MKKNIHPKWSQNELVSKRNCYKDQPGESPEAISTPQLVERDPTELEREKAELALRVLDGSHIRGIVEIIETDPSKITQEQKDTIKGLILVQAAQQAPQNGIDFQAWAETITSPQLRQIVNIANQQGFDLLETVGIQWNNIQTQSRDISTIGKSVLDSVKGGTQKALEEFNQWAQKNPALAIAAMLGGAYACSKIIGKVIGEGYISKAVHLAGGAVIAGKTLQLRGVKDWIYSALGVRVDDWRIGKSLQELGSLEFGRALTVLSGGDPNERSAGDVTQSHENLERLIFENEGFADIIFGQENLLAAMKNNILPALQTMVPPRIAVGKSYEDLNPEERKILLQYALEHPGMIPEGNGKKYEEVNNKEKIDQVDLVFGELQRAKEVLEAKSDQQILDMVKTEVSGMTEFSVFLNQINDEQRAEVARNMKEQLLATFDGFSELEQMMDQWKQGDPPTLPRGAAIQLVRLEEIFSEYVGNIKDLQASEKVNKVIKLATIATFISGLGPVGATFMIISAGGAGLKIVYQVCKWGKALWNMKGAGGPLIATAIILISAGAYIYTEGAIERQRRTSRNPEGWLEFAKTQVRNPEDVQEKLYELVYLQNDDRAWTGNAVMREFFLDTKGTEVLELRQCREYILKGAVIAELEKAAFPANFPAEKLQQYKDRAFQFIDQEYRDRHYTPERRGEAADWVHKALLYSTLLDTYPTGVALERARSGLRSEAQEEIMERRRETSELNPSHQIERPLNILSSIDRRASLSLAADLYYLKEIRTDRSLSQKIPGYDPSKANDYEEAYGVAVDHLELHGAEGEMLTRMTQGGYNQLKGMIEHTDLTSDQNEQWGTLPNAEAARLGVFLEMYDKYPQEREVLGLASHATQLLKKMYFENAPENMKLPVGRYVLNPIESVRLNSRMGEYLKSVEVIWKILPELMERLKQIQDPKMKLELSYQFFQLLEAQQVGENASHTMESARTIMNQVLERVSQPVLITEKRTNFSNEEFSRIIQSTQEQLTTLEGSSFNSQSRAITLNNGNNGEILMSSSGYNATITYDASRKIYTMRGMEFEGSFRGLQQALMSASKINNLVSRYLQETFEPEAVTNGNYFYMNDWLGVHIAESETVGIDDLVLTQEELYFVTNDKNSFLIALNQLMREAIQNK